MADQNGGQVPDLASVLANLAALVPTTSQPQQSVPNGIDAHHGVQQQSIPATPEDAAFNLAQTLQAIRQQPPPASVTPTQDPRSLSLHRRSTPVVPQMPATPVIDPATIIDWPQGLRCVSKIASQNPNFKPALQKMMTEQTKHELQWFSTRKSLEAQRATQAELEAYDMKVYRASRQMVDVMTVQLKSLGVPFFGVVSEKIMSAEEKTSGEQMMISQPTTSRPAKITEEELLRLQRKMLEYLEDMYRG